MVSDISFGMDMYIFHLKAFISNYGKVDYKFSELICVERCFKKQVSTWNLRKTHVLF